MTAISIIVPIYKVSEQYLRECLNSIISQNMQDVECILVSDGAPEQEEAICKEYCSKDSRFRFVHKEHSGVSATRNKGIREAKGEYISFIDADDTIAVGIYEKAYKEAIEHNSDVVIWDVGAEPSLNDTSKDISNNQKILTSHSIHFVSSWCKLYKRELLIRNSILFDTSLGFGEDREFNISFFQVARKIFYLKEEGYFYRTTENSTTNKYYPNFWETAQKFLNKLKVKKVSQSEIAYEYISFFFLSWKLDYFNKQNPDQFAPRLSKIRKLWQSKDFQDSISKLSDEEKNNFSKILKIELFFLRHNIFVLVWLHGIKNYFFR